MSSMLFSCGIRETAKVWCILYHIPFDIIIARVHILLYIYIVYVCLRDGCAGSGQYQETAELYLCHPLSHHIYVQLLNAKWEVQRGAYIICSYYYIAGLAGLVGCGAGPVRGHPFMTLSPSGYWCPTCCPYPFERRITNCPAHGRTGRQ